MPLFRKKPKNDSDGLVLSELDEILGYLDEVYRKKLPLTYTYNKKGYQTDILSLESKTKSMRIQSGGSMRIPNGADVDVGFCLDKTWWTFKTKFALILEKPHLLIPKVIEYAERRQVPRTAFTAREQVKVTILEGLGSGNGVFGMARDVSSEGMCLTIEKAMMLSSEKEVVPTPTLFNEGTKLAIVKINRIPGCPLIECSGIANRVYRDGKWCFAFKFDGLPKAMEAMIARFIEPRILPFKPTRRSYKKRLEDEGVTLGSSSPREGEAPTERRTAAPLPPSDVARPVVEAPRPPEVKAPAPDRVKMLVVGDLLDELPFLMDASCPFEVFPGSSPVSIIKVLTENQPALMLCGVEFKGRSMLEVLEKIQAMGVGKNTTVVICAADLPGKDLIKFRMMQIDNVVSPPTGDPAPFLEKLLTLVPKS